MMEPTCPSCYDSFSGWWCDRCDQWPCICAGMDEPSETYWGEPITEEEQRLVAEAQLAALFRLAGV